MNRGLTTTGVGAGILLLGLLMGVLAIGMTANLYFAQSHPVSLVDAASVSTPLWILGVLFGVGGGLLVGREESVE